MAEKVAAAKVGDTAIDVKAEKKPEAAANSASGVEHTKAVIWKLYHKSTQ